LRSEVVFQHTVSDLALPARLVTEEEAERAGSAAAELLARKPVPGSFEHGRLRAEQIVVQRYEEQTPDLEYDMELHVLRLGDVAIVTNPFELYLDYGLRIKARSRALHTLVVQLSCGSGIYLPTPKAVAGGHYSATVHSNLVGPEGGQVLVDETVRAINEMWADDAE